VGRGGAQRPVRRGNELKKMGARSAWARTRGKNPLVLNRLLRDKISRGGRVPRDMHKGGIKFVEWDGVVVASTGPPLDLEARGLI
jgi:hypothetical protein